MDTYIFGFSVVYGIFIFSSIFVIKVDRYFVLMAPAISFFLLLGLSEISKRLQFKFKEKNLTFPILAIILTVMIYCQPRLFYQPLKKTSTIKFRTDK